MPRDPRSWIKATAYGALDLVTGHRGIRRTISGEPIRFPARWSRYYPEVYEPEKFAFIRKHVTAGATVMDVGAHIGLFSVFMARLVGPAGRVFSFEPTPFTRHVLSETIRLNDCRKVVEIHEEAIARRGGTATFFDTGAPLSNANSLVATPAMRGQLSVPTTSIDAFVAERGIKLAFLKIDAEGGELEILEGARETLRRDRPCVQLEIHPAPLADQAGALGTLWKLFSETGMRVERDGQVLTETMFTQLAEAVELQLVPISGA